MPVTQPTPQPVQMNYTVDSMVYIPTANGGGDDPFVAVTGKVNGVQVTTQILLSSIGAAADAASFEALVQPALLRAYNASQPPAPQVTASITPMATAFTA